MASLLQDTDDSMGIRSIRPRLVKTTPGINTLMKAVDLMVVHSGDGLPAEVMKSVAAAVEELKEAVVQQTAEMKQQKEGSSRTLLK